VTKKERKVSRNKRSMEREKGFEVACPTLSYPILSYHIASYHIASHTFQYCHHCVYERLDLILLVDDVSSNQDVEFVRMLSHERLYVPPPVQLLRHDRAVYGGVNICIVLCCGVMR
jgi:hypothetical protein